MDEVLTDDQSHYEISLTAGQAFVAFVLLLLSLAASFAFGLLIGKGQADERLVMRKDAPVVTEASAVPGQKTATATEVTTDDFKESTPATPVSHPAKTAVKNVTSTIDETGAAPAAASPAAVPAKVPAAAQIQPAGTIAAAPAGPAYAQLVSTSEQKTAEALAAKLIEGGFKEAYVERMTSDKGTIFRVRIKFASDAEARAAEGKLKTFSKDVWITSK